jgi:hypothetical protein
MKFFSFEGAPCHHKRSRSVVTSNSSSFQHRLFAWELHPLVISKTSWESNSPRSEWNYDFDINKKIHHCLWNVLEGCFVVYMGRKHQKIVIQTKLLHHFLFKTLLANFKEFGFKNQGGLWISCEPNVFKCLLLQLEFLYFLLSKLQC